MPQEQRVDWGSLFRDGTVIDLTVSIWTAKAGIKTKDLAIADTDEVSRVLTLGTARLVPKKSLEKIKEIAASAKRLVEYNSLNFPFVWGARYTPNAKLQTVLDGLKEHQNRFNIARDTFVDLEYGPIQREMEPVIEKALRDASRIPDVVDTAILRIMDEYPTPEVVRQKFNLTWNVYAISGPRAEAATELATAEAENVKSIVRSMAVQLREEFQEKAQAIMASVAKGGKLHANTVASTLETLTRVEEMNIFGDRELAKQVSALRRFIEGAADSRIERTEIAGMTQELINIQTAISQSTEQAIAEAERNLTGLGRRVLDVPSEGVS